MKITKIYLHKSGTQEIVTFDNGEEPTTINNVDRKLVDEYYKNGGKLIMPELN